ncbi:hypothetical protein HELRODRAFT_182993 [Helobdella robusta]|uniref:Ig-like domain-containing protein n=1 Tax=Helobdella robusta TaxID=6412 RepID=T1FJ24_HELRO|nr:hypothetical protein HELRODRAFT_182993 [Helobdella robusta]ESN89982.1 hypothetical protein HELRODRAFT_182993 [Helobdella robusta]
MKITHFNKLFQIFITVFILLTTAIATYHQEVTTAATNAPSTASADIETSQKSAHGFKASYGVSFEKGAIESNCSEVCSSTNCTFENCFMAIMNEPFPALAIKAELHLSFINVRFGKINKSFFDWLTIIKLLIENCVTQYRIPENLFSNVLFLKQLYIVNSPNFSDIFWSNDAFVFPLMRSLEELFVDENIPDDEQAILSTASVLQSSPNFRTLVLTGNTRALKVLNKLKRIRRLTFRDIQFYYVLEYLKLWNVQASVRQLVFDRVGQLNLNDNVLETFTNLHSVALYSCPDVNVDDDLYKVMYFTNITAYDQPDVQKKLDAIYAKAVQNLREYPIDEFSEEDLLMQTPNDDEDEHADFTTKPRGTTIKKKTLEILDAKAEIQANNLRISCEVVGKAPIYVSVKFPNGSSVNFMKEVTQPSYVFVYNEANVDICNRKGAFVCSAQSAFGGSDSFEFSLFEELRVKSDCWMVRMKSFGMVGAFGIVGFFSW